MDTQPACLRDVSQAGTQRHFKASLVYAVKLGSGIDGGEPFYSRFSAGRISFFDTKAPGLALIQVACRRDSGHRRRRRGRSKGRAEH